MTETADPTLTSEGNLDSFPAEAQLVGSTCLCLKRVSKVGRPVAKKNILLRSVLVFITGIVSPFNTFVQ